MIDAMVIDGVLVKRSDGKMIDGMMVKWLMCDGEIVGKVVVKWLITMAKWFIGDGVVVTWLMEK